MKQALFRSMVALVLLVAGSLCALAQVTTTGQIAGATTDQAGAIVAGATIVVKNNATNQETTVTASDDGTYTVPALSAGTYTVIITAQGFKQSLVKDVTVQAGKPSTVNIALEVGAVNETVTITGASAELLNSTNANVSSTITGKQVHELPYASRDALDVVLFLPGTQTVGRPRSSTINGLPKGEINITLDGINVQDNVLKSSDGFFTYVRPRADAIEEVTLSSATPGSDSGGEGAVQIKFTTQAGSNEYHGSVYETYRNHHLNGNFYFNNRDLAEDPVDKKAPRTFQIFNQPGAKFGGPISIPGVFNGKDKAFFFVNFEEFRLSEKSPVRTRTVFNPAVLTGNFSYVVGTTTRTVNLLSLATSQGLTSTLDPTIGTLLNQIQATTNGGLIVPTSDPNLNQFSFFNAGKQDRYFPTVRFDFNLSKNHHLENIYNYQDFGATTDFLNGTDPQFPGFPNTGSQTSNRFSDSLGLRSTLSSSLVNEARFGLTGGTSLFLPQVTPAQFANQGGFDLNIDNAGITPATTNFGNGPSRRNSPVKQFSDTLTYSRGNHNMNFGGSFSQIDAWLFGIGQLVPTIDFSNTPDELEQNGALFGTVSNTFLPGASTAQIAQAEQIYRVLVGRLTQVSSQAVINEAGTSYTPQGGSTERYRQREYGFYGQDSWRIRPNLTLNFGLRYELQQAPFSRNKALAQIPFDTLSGRCGTGISSLFRPGGCTGQPTKSIALPPGQKLYNTDKNNFAPSVGFAWQPNFKSGLLGRLVGNTGQTVVRGGYAIAYGREGLNITSSIVGANPGLTIDTSRFAGDAFNNGTLFRNFNTQVPAPRLPSGSLLPKTLGFDPLTGTFDYGESANAFSPNLKTPYAISFSFGVQRELFRDTVLEVRYVGTRGKQQLRQIDLNRELATIESGLAGDFRAAQQNLLFNIANNRCQPGVTSANCQFNFAFTGPGTTPLPLLLQFFSGQSPTALNSSATASYTSSTFRSGTFTGPLNPVNTNVLTFARNLSDPLFQPFYGRGTQAGLPANILEANPQVHFFFNAGNVGGDFIVNNDGKSWYDGGVIELRRRLANGLLVQGSYTFSKSLTNVYANSSVVFSQPTTLRNTWLDKSNSPFDITHSFKLTYIAEVPIGRGKQFLGESHGLAGMLLGGWAVHGTVRAQSGSPVRFGNVQLVGMTPKDLQRLIEIRKTADRKVFWLPDDVLTNTIRAFNTATLGPNTASNPFASQGYSSRGVPTGRYIAPAGANCIQDFPGKCGFANLVLHGPRFIRVDTAIVKNFRITETKNIQFRTELLNTINNINFRVGRFQDDAVSVGSTGVPTFSSASFGQLTSPDVAYRDNSTTNDPGGRLVQFVLRFNF